MKKTISIVLIPFLLLQLYSCYSMQGISHEELIGQLEKGDIRITTTQSEIYEFKSFNYFIKSDTLFGSGEKIVDQFKTTPFSGKIPVSDIQFIEASKFNTASTCVAIGAGGVLAALIIFGLFLHEVHEDFHQGCN